MTDKIEIGYDKLIPETLRAMTDSGILLVTQGKDGKPNPMTIGWALIGSLWAQPVFCVLVRPSRYSHKLLADNGDFTVNVMPDTMKKALAACGSASGRDTDKFRDCGMTTMDALQGKTPIIAESLISYECRTLMKNEVLPETLDTEIRNSAYRGGNFHTMYYGKILAVRAERGIIAQ